MEGRVGLLDRLGGLFGETRIALSTIGNEAEDPVARSDELGSDRGQQEVVREAVAPADECVRCPP